MVTIADPIEIAGLKIRNRTVMPPMVTNLASDKGEVTSKLIEHYERRGKGEVGLIIIEASAIEWEHRISEKNIGIYDDSLITGLSNLTKRIKTQGAKVFIQLNHSGPNKAIKTKFVGPSKIQVREGPIPEELSKGEIMKIKGLFFDAAKRAKDAGFNGVEIHAAHFFLLSSFLSSYTNQRDDEYGGNTEAKTKLVVDIIKEIKHELGSFPVQCRMNSIENYVRGIDIEEAVEIARILEKAGADSLHISGYNRPMLKEVARYSREDKPSILEGFPWGCYIPCAARIKNTVDIPVVGVGMVQTSEFAKRVIQEELCDLVAIGRGLLGDPEFVSKVLSGRSEEIIPYSE